MYAWNTPKEAFEQAVGVSDITSTAKQKSHFMLQRLVNIRFGMDQRVSIQIPS